MIRLTSLLAIPLLAAGADDAAIVRASGEGVVSMKPDRATVTIGVVSQANTADAASSQNAQQLTAVLNQLKAALGAGADIRTSGYSLNPVYRYPSNGGPSITGYSATNTVVVKIDDLARLGPALDAAAKNGANSIHGVSFELKDEKSARSEALALASRNARSNAEAIARSLGLRVVRIRAVESADAGRPVPVQPLFRAMEAGAARAPTPVEAGAIEIRAAATITVEVAQ